jgi:hypothetical protein
MGSVLFSDMIQTDREKSPNLICFHYQSWSTCIITVNSVFIFSISKIVQYHSSLSELMPCSFNFSRCSFIAFTCSV